MWEFFWRPYRITDTSFDQRTGNSLERQLGELSRKIGTDIRPVYTSRKIRSEIKPKEEKPPIVNQECVVYHF